jgi:hypothetical protein
MGAGFSALQMSLLNVAAGNREASEFRALIIKKRLFATRFDAQDCHFLQALISFHRASAAAGHARLNRIHITAAARRVA